MGKVRQLFFVSRVRDVLPLLAALLIPRKLKLSLAVVFQKQPPVSLAPAGNFDPHPRPLAIELYALVYGYRDLAHTTSMTNTQFPGELAVLRGQKSPRCSS